MADNINAAGYETKPWWPYVRSLMEGGGSVTVEQLNVTENGTYTAETGKAYSPVVVNVPSDFYKAVVTVANNTSESTFNIMASMYSDIENIIAFQWNEDVIVFPGDEGGYACVSGEETTGTYYIRNGDYIFGFSETITDAGNYAVTGDAEVLTLQDLPGGNLVVVKITGDCTITVSDSE